MITITHSYNNYKVESSVLSGLAEQAHATLAAQQSAARAQELAHLVQAAERVNFDRAKALPGLSSGLAEALSARINQIAAELNS